MKALQARGVGGAGQWPGAARPRPRRGGGAGGRIADLMKYVPFYIPVLDVNLSVHSYA